jgi:CBS domain-containing protein
VAIGLICQREVDLVEVGETVQEASRRMAQRGVGTLVVVNEAREPIGIVTDRDLITRVLSSGKNARTTLVGSVMTLRPKRVREETPVEKALSIMRDGQFRRLPVVDADGKLTGIVSIDDILLLLSSELGQIKQLLLAQTPSRSVVQTASFPAEAAHGSPDGESGCTCQADRRAAPDPLTRSS